MDAKDYRSGVIRAFEGELFGAALMRRLAGRPDMQDRRAALRRTERLERLMAEALGEILPAECDRAASAVRAESRAAIEAARLPDHAALVELTAASIAPALDRFVALAAAAPPEHREVMALLVEHERVLGDGPGADTALFNGIVERLERRAAGRRAPA